MIMPRTARFRFPALPGSRLGRRISWKMRGEAKERGCVVASIDRSERLFNSCAFHPGPNADGPFQMTYRAILAVIDETAGSEAVIAAAFSIGSELAAYVEAFHVEPNPETILMMPGRSADRPAPLLEHLAALRAGVAQRQAQVRRQFDERCGVEEVPMLDDAESAEPDRFAASLRQVTGDGSVEVAQRARSFDLTVIASPYAAAEGMGRETFETLLFDSGRPLLVVPPDVSIASLRSIAIAWNGSREATHAAVAAMPLLRRAEDICLISISEGGRVYRAEEFGWYLDLHGLDVVVHDENPAGASVEETLFRTVDEISADILVMGAYGHGRMREFLLGGVTRYALKTSTTPLFLVH